MSKHFLFDRPLYKPFRGRPLDVPAGNSYHDLRPSLYHDYLANNASSHEKVCVHSLTGGFSGDNLRNVPCKR